MGIGPVERIYLFFYVGSIVAVIMGVFSNFDWFLVGTGLILACIPLVCVKVPIIGWIFWWAWKGLLYLKKISRFITSSL
jgi:hypothetical protein